MSNQFYGITEVSIELGISTDMIRNAEKKGIVSPRQTHGKHRRYTQEDIEKIRSFAGLKPETKIDEIKRILTKALSLLEGLAVAKPTTLFFKPETPNEDVERIHEKLKRAFSQNPTDEKGKPICICSMAGPCELHKEC